MRTAVVTGGGSGIGLAVAERLRKDGYQVATVDLKPSETQFAFTADVTDRAQIDAALSGIREQLGPVTVLVNAAGLDGFKRFHHIEFADWQRLIDVNLNGVFHMIQAVLPDMLDAKWGRIVNISSSSTHSGAPYMSHYVAAKSAVNGLTKSLARALAPEIRVNPVSYWASMAAETHRRRMDFGYGTERGSCGTAAGPGSGKSRVRYGCGARPGSQSRRAVGRGRRRHHRGRPVP